MLSIRFRLVVFVLLLILAASSTMAAAEPEAKPHPNGRVHAAPSPRAADAVTEAWPCLYGPRRDGHSRETQLLKAWPDSGPKLLWEIERGEGYASPVVAGDRLVYTHLRDNTAIVECLRPTDGARYWEFRFTSDFDGEIIDNDGPRASPVIAGDRVFVHDIAGDLYCLDLATGRPIWHRDLQEEFDLPDSFFGVCSTPLVWGDRLIVNLGAMRERGTSTDEAENENPNEKGNETDSDGPCVVALDLATGKRVWAAPATGGASCAPPIAAEIGGRPWVFLLTGGKSKPPVGAFVALDPRDGTVDFEIPWRARTFYSVNACVPVLVDDRVLIMSDKGVGCALIEPRLDPKTGKASGEILWHNRDVSLEFVGTVHDAGRLYVFDGEDRIRPGLVCLDAESGKQLWRDAMTLDGGGRPGQGSLLFVDGDALCLGERGHLFWLRLEPEGPKILAQHRLFAAGESWTPPVVHDGLLYIAQNAPDEAAGTGRRLLCYDLRNR